MKSPAKPPIPISSAKNGEPPSRSSFQGIVMSKTLAGILLLFSAVAIQAQEKVVPQEPNNQDASALVDRIEQLEKRIRELERQLTQQPGRGAWGTLPSHPSLPPPVPPQANPQHPIPPQFPQQLYPPSQYPPSQRPPEWSAPPVTPYPYYQPGPPPSVPAMPAAPKGQDVPDSWKPFDFNGQQYYIIPIDEAMRLVRP